ncbi:hypothetical protein AAHB94_31210 [Bacillus toyonensis]
MGKKSLFVKNVKKIEGENAKTLGITGFLNTQKFDNTTPLYRVLFATVLGLVLLFNWGT